MSLAKASLTSFSITIPLDKALSREIISELALPIAGLMSDREFDYVVDKCEELNQAAHSIGCELNDPFMTMGFLSLPVIPELKITDKGVFDTNKFDFIDVINVTALQA